MGKLSYSAPQKRAHWNLRAEEMRSLAEEAHDPEVAAMMRGIAVDYERLARWAKESEGLGIDLAPAVASRRRRTAGNGGRDRRLPQGEDRENI
jgi:hypothetical protein